MQTFNDFIMSTPGRLTSLAAALVILLGAMALFNSKKKKQKFSVVTLTYSAISIALALVLSRIKLFPMPQGGSVTLCSMFFVAVVGYWFGPSKGIAAGVAHGLLRLALGPDVVHPIQLLMDYPVAFGLLGLSGFFSSPKFGSYGLYIGYGVGCLGRFAAHFISGVIFFGEYAKGQNVFLYSLEYNGPYILTEACITIAILLIPAVRLAVNRVKLSASPAGA